MAKRLSKKERVELEKNFLSSVIAGIDDKDLRRETAAYGITWRDFSDRRHQALWRALEELDLTEGLEERVDALIQESGRTKEDVGDDYGAIKDFYRKAEGPGWLEHEFAVTGALLLLGRKYLQEICGAYPVAAAAGQFARQLGFIKK